MKRTTAFTIILGLYGAPALAADTHGHLVPAGSLKDAPRSIDSYRHHLALPMWRGYCPYNDRVDPVICETAAKPPRAPGGGASKAPGAR
mgnify:CR=1 FL=1